MNFFIGVMAVCVAQEQKCTAHVTPAIFPSEALCREYVAKTYKSRKVYCVQAEQIGGMASTAAPSTPAIVPAIPAVTPPKVEAVPKIEEELPEIMPATEEDLDVTTVKLEGL